jgi:RimJ/RimL family protein N-acetyltransferase
MTVVWEGRDRLGELLVLRRADVSDATQWLLHTRRIVAETPFMLQSPSDTLMTVGEQQRQLRRFESQPGCLALIAERPERRRRTPILGTLTLAASALPRLAHASELSMGVARVAWGRGIGDALLRAGLALAREDAALVRIGLQVFASNTPAMKLYLKHGFTAEGRLRRYARVGTVYEDVIPMGIWLGGDENEDGARDATA